MELDDIELEELKPRIESQSEIKVDQRKVFAFINIFWCLVSICLLLLWISESKFGEGVLRPKYLNESCSYDNSGPFGPGTGRQCVAGLSCVYQKCTEQQQIVYENYTCPETKCEVCKPNSFLIVKKVSYFDYNEFPNGFLKPASVNFISDLSYGACKELCSKQDNCTALCFSDKKCFLKSNYILPPLYETNTAMWTCAVKL